MQFSARLRSPARPTALALPRPSLAHMRTAAFWLTFVAAFAAVLVQRWLQIGAYVTGMDVGNWFAFGRGALGGVGPTGGGAYPPLVPAALALSRDLFGAMLAAKLIGLGSLGAVMAATFAVASRGMNRWLALTVALAVGLANVIADPTAFGGYPQNYALAFLLLTALAIAYVSDALLNGERLPRRMALLAAAALTEAALCHHAYFALACLVVVIAWLLFVLARPGWRMLLRGTALFAAIGVPAMLCFLPTYLQLRRQGYSAPIDASHQSLQTALRYAIVTAPWLWIPLLSAGVAYALLTPRLRNRPTARVAATLLIASLAFLPTGESRLLPLLILGGTLSAGLALDAVQREVAGTRWLALPLTAAVAFVVLLYPLATAQAARMYSYYRTADQPLLSTAAWLDAHRADGTVAVRKDSRGWPIGWWFEGLSRAEVYVGSDPQWLAFPLEQQHRAVVQQLFMTNLSAIGVRAAAHAAGIRYLVLRKQDTTIWQRWTDDPQAPLATVYDDGEFMILDAR